MNDFKRKDKIVVHSYLIIDKISRFLLLQAECKIWAFYTMSLIGIILRWGFLIWELIFYLLRTFCPQFGRFFFLCCFFFHYVSAKFHLWPSSGDLPQPRIGMLSLVTVSPVITAFHSCLSHHVFDQVNLWPAWVGFETPIFWQCSPGTIETQRLYPLRHGQDSSFKSYPSQPEVYLVKNVVR